MLQDVGSNLVSFKLFMQHLAKNKKSVIVSSEICIKTFEMANSVDECADERFSPEPIVLETLRKRDHDEIAEDAIRSTSCVDNKHPALVNQQCWAMLLPLQQALKFPRCFEIFLTYTRHVFAP